MAKRDRRGFLTLSAVAALSSCTKPKAAPSELGAPMSEYGQRSPFEKAARAFKTPTPGTGGSRTPLQDTYGIITPAPLHFERHHAGVPAIDPAKHELLVHGLVEREQIFSLDALKRLPSVSRIHFVECSGNSGSEWVNPADTAQRSHGLASCSEWTGVLLKTVLEEAGVKPGASWVIAEGADACLMARSIPLAKCLDDAMLVYGQNGEAIRPEQGYPLRLLLPGWEGNACIKWLRRLHVTSEPMLSREETAHYTDLMPDGKARQFTFDMDAKSVILRPSGGQNAVPGFIEITGIAWSGRGRIDKVEVSTDGGKTWVAATLDEPRFTKAFTRFRLPWNWDGQPVDIASRATDETGYTQPTTEELVAVRGTRSGYHHNGIKVWRLAADGKVKNA
jgi:sulfane dehydrogenase subunit SoxC